MLLAGVLVSLALAVAGSPGVIEFAERHPPSACTAPSGRPGDCLLASRCPGGPANRSRDTCGYVHPNFLFCCERRPPVAAPVTRAPSVTVSAPVTRAPSVTVSALSADCGRGGKTTRRRRNIALNIFGGRSSMRESWPWAVLLGARQADGSIKWLCGGTLLSKRHVLTAAHCRQFVPLDQLVVRVGEHDLSTTADGEHQDLAVSRADQHPDYRASHNDMMVLHLATPAKLGDSVQPICLPEPKAKFVNKTAYVVGWGQLRALDKNSQPETLQEALVKVIATEPCEAFYRENIPQYSTRFPRGFGGRVLCATSEEDACQGDSGGPLQVQGSDGRWRLAGVVLEGVGCGNPEFPGLYTRVTSYLEWIKAVLGGA